jgi:hypothetical protein
VPRRRGEAAGLAVGSPGVAAAEPRPGGRGDRGGATSRVTGIQRFKSLDEQYLTPIFTLDEEDQDGSTTRR